MDFLNDWMADPNDGLLVLDKNANGSVDSGNELLVTILYFCGTTQPMLLRFAAYDDNVTVRLIPR
jgi:hypothetical protein